MNSGVLFVNYACACKTAVLKDSFSNPFRIFQAKGKNENPKIRKNRYHSMISGLKLKNCILDVKGTACIKLTNARKSEGEASAIDE